MSDLITGKPPMLIGQLCEKDNESDTVNNVTDASVRLLVLAQGSLALDTITTSLLQLEPALTSLAANVPAHAIDAMQSKAEMLRWEDLISQARQATRELTEAVNEAEGATLSALGLEPLAFLLDDLSKIEGCLRKLMAASASDKPGVSELNPDHGKSVDPSLDAATDAQVDLDALDGMLFGQEGVSDEAGSLGESTPQSPMSELDDDPPSDPDCSLKSGPN